jgi:flagellar assembly factor FliW
VELYNAKERIRLLELKYQKEFLEFESWMEQTEEDFEVWNDYLQWKAYERLIKDLTQEIVDVDNATDIQIT